MKKTKAKLYQWLIPENVYRYPIRLIICEDHELVTEWLQKNYHPNIRPISAGLSGRTCSVEGGTEIAVWIRSAKNLAVLGHEIIHAVFMILSDKGVPINGENDEAFAYLFEYLFGEAAYLAGHGALTHRRG